MITESIGRECVGGFDGRADGHVEIPGQGHWYQPHDLRYLARGSVLAPVAVDLSRELSESVGATVVCGAATLER